MDKKKILIVLLTVSVVSGASCLGLYYRYAEKQREAKRKSDDYYLDALHSDLYKYEETGSEEYLKRVEETKEKMREGGYLYANIESMENKAKKKAIENFEYVQDIIQKAEKAEVFLKNLDEIEQAIRQLDDINGVCFNVYQSFQILIDLSQETRSFFEALFAFRNASKYADTGFQLDSFIKNQVFQFATISDNFENIASQLSTLNNGKEAILTDIENIILYFKDYSDRYVKIIKLIVKDYNNLDATELSARTYSKFQRDWHQIIHLVVEFCKKYKDNLTPEEQSRLSFLIEEKFEEEVEKFISVFNTKGAAEAFGLKFCNGAWLPITIFLFLDEERLSIG